MDNGLTVIHQYLPATPVVVVDVWVRAGARLEPKGWYGMAHFLEHMIFKGSPSLGPGIFDQVIENNGGVANAATSHDYAHFFITTASKYLPETLAALAEILLNAAIPEDEFILERDVVLEELRQTCDSPDWLGFQSLMENVYDSHSYGRSILGTEDDLMAHTPQQMRRFHRYYYQPQNMTVVIVGGVAKEQALELVNQSFQNFPTPLDCPLPETDVELAISGVKRQELYLPRIEQARLLMGWTAPGVKQVRTAYGLDLISVLLTEGRCSRLVRELREELQLVQSISGSFSLQQESSLFTISACLEPQYVKQVEKIICDYLSQLHSTPISEAELARCKRLLCNDYAFSTEAPSQLAGLYGYYSTIATPELSVTYPEQIQSFQLSDLQKLARQYLCPHNYAVTVLQPSWC